MTLRKAILIKRSLSQHILQFWRASQERFLTNFSFHYFISNYKYWYTDSKIVIIKSTCNLLSLWTIVSFTIQLQLGNKGRNGERLIQRKEAFFDHYVHGIEKLTNISLAMSQLDLSAGLL